MIEAAAGFSGFATSFSGSLGDGVRADVVGEVVPWPFREDWVRCLRTGVMSLTAECSGMAMFSRGQFLALAGSRAGRYGLYFEKGRGRGGRYTGVAEG